MERNLEYDLLFEVRQSIRYHSKRADFFSFLNKSITAISIISGSAVFAFILSKTTNDGNYWPSIISSAIITILSTIGLTFGYSSREQLHSELKIKFINLERNIIKCENLDEKTLKEFNSERLSIETNEPAISQTLNEVCYNEQAIAEGSDESVDVGRFRKFTCQIYPNFLCPKTKIITEPNN